MKTETPFTALSARIVERLDRAGVKLTIGGEPSYVPVNPEGPEWSITALGPTKLGYAYALAEALLRDVTPGALLFYSPGKLYPGEVNPRWALQLVWNRDGNPIPGATHMLPGKQKQTFSLEALRGEILTRLKLRGKWTSASEEGQKRASAWVLPLDHDGERWQTERWFDGKCMLLNASGPAGLRLPLAALPEAAKKRALVLEPKDDGLHIFFPPLLQINWLPLVEAVARALNHTGAGRCFYEGYVPGDEQRGWRSLGIAADPGVLEINLPPCESAAEYARWMEQLEQSGAEVGLRSHKQVSPEETLGTGGGNHLLFGGPSLEENAFFRNPRWVTSILRYWQRHPSLSYLFTGAYVGPSSQAPRPDESSGELYDLEMAYRFLESLPPGEDHRVLISDTLRHLHIDRSGNTHRSEASFDKFWNAGWDGGCRGLIEFRAIETLPHASWMSAVALLWKALAAMLLEQPHTDPLIDHADALHDAFFLPEPLWADFEQVLGDLRKARFAPDRAIFRAIWEYRFPQMLSHRQLVVRKALEGWPLLCETPLEGGSTSRYVDTSMERLEFAASPAFAGKHRVFVQGRELPLGPLAGGKTGAGLRYRRSAWRPSLHPGLPPHMPLTVTIADRQGRPVSSFELHEGRRRFEKAATHPELIETPCRKMRPHMQTCDLRLL
jgi:uncharacterized protein (DUF2126 family)